MPLAHRLTALCFSGALAIAAPFAAAQSAATQPVLIAAKPAQGATARQVTRISLTFDQPLEAALSGMDLVMTAMPGMADHAPMKMNGVRTSLSPDHRTVLATLVRPLPLGSYEANWHVTAAVQTRRTTGRIAFTVK